MGKNSIMAVEFILIVTFQDVSDTFEKATDFTRQKLSL